MSSLFDLIYSQSSQPLQSQPTNDQPSSSSSSSSSSAAFTPFPKASALKSYSQYTDTQSQSVYDTIPRDRTVRRQLSVQFAQLPATRSKRRLLADLGESDEDREEGEDSADSEEEDLAADPNQREKRAAKNRGRFLGAVPRVPRGVLPLYHQSPMFAHKAATHFENRLKQYCPNELSFVRFPQSERSVLATQREIVRTLWLRCYHGKDYEGALMALQVLAEIDSIDLSDVEKLAEIVNIADSNSDQLLQLLAQKASHLNNLRSAKYSPVRASLLALFAEIFFSRGDTEQARRVFRTNRSDLAFTTSALLLAYDTIIACQQAYEAAQRVWGELSLEDSLSLPSGEDIVRDPLSLFFVVKTLRLAAQGGCTNEDVNSRKQEIHRVLRDLSMSFSLSTQSSDALEWIDFQLLHIGFLRATRAMTKARDAIGAVLQYHHDKVRNKDARLFAVNMSRLYEGVSRLSFSSEPTLSRALSAELAVLTKVMQFQTREGLQREERVYVAWLLFSMEIVSKERLVEIVADFIEHSPPQGEHLYEVSRPPLEETETNERSLAHVYERSAFSPAHWVAWKLLAVLLGPIPAAMDANAPISPHTDIARHLVEVCVASERVLPLGGTQKAEKRTPHTEEQWVFKEQCEWWTESILSASSLDDLSSSVVAFDYADVVVTLPSRFELMEPLIELDLQYLFQHKRPSPCEARQALDRALDENFTDEEEDADGSTLEETELFVGDDKRALWALLTTGPHLSALGLKTAPAEAPSSSSSSSKARKEERGDAIDLQQLSTLLSSQWDEQMEEQMGEILSLFFPHSFGQQSSESADERRPLHQLFDKYHTTETSSKCADFGVYRITRFLHEHAEKLIVRWNFRSYNEETVFLLGKRVLEILTFQALVCCHIASQDNFFLLRVVQILMLNALLGLNESNRETAANCLAFLHFHNINVERALLLASECAFRDFDPNVPPPNAFLLPTKEPLVTGRKDYFYKPVPYR